MSIPSCKRRLLLSANSRDLKFYEQNWYHWEERRPFHQEIDNNLPLTYDLTCPECSGEVTYERDHDETVCTQCGLVISSSHRYVAGHRIYLPFIDDRPPQEPFDRIVWWTQFYKDFSEFNFIYPDDRRYYIDQKQASNRS